MRTKSEEKRQKIIDIASVEFLARSFDTVSMSDIAAALGGSKATLYNYFNSKEEVFIAVMMSNAHKLAQKVYAVLDKDMSLETKLNRFGYEYLAFILSQEMIDMKRRVIAQADQVNIGLHIYESGVKASWGPIAHLLEKGMLDQTVRQADPWLAAMQLKALLEADLYTRRILNVDQKLNKKKLPTAVENALKVFWNYYKL
jgi:AcrR family transcriptional regulator